MLSLGRQKKKDKYKQMKNEPHKKTGKVSPYPGGMFVCVCMLSSNRS